MAFSNNINNHQKGLKFSDNENHQNNDFGYAHENNRFYSSHNDLSRNDNNIKTNPQQHHPQDAPQFYDAQEQLPNNIHAKPPCCGHTYSSSLPKDVCCGNVRSRETNQSPTNYSQTKTKTDHRSAENGCCKQQVHQNKSRKLHNVVKPSDCNVDGVCNGGFPHQNGVMNQKDSDINTPNYEISHHTDNNDRYNDDDDDDDNNDDDDECLLRQSSTSVTSSSKKNPPELLQQKLPFSLLRARLSLLVAVVCYSAAMVQGVMISQYLLDRSYEEANYNKSAHSHDKACGANKSDPLVMLDNAIQSKVSTELMHYSLANTAPAFITCLVWGAIIDLAGRKLAVISSTFGSLGMSIVVFCIVKFNLDTHYFYLAYAFDGICGSFFVFLIANYAMLADISTNKKGLIFWIACFQAIPLVTSSALNIGVGYLIQEMGYVITSIVSIIPCALSFIIVVIFVPETLPTPRKRVTAQKLGVAIVRIINLYTKDGNKNRRWSLFLSLLIFFTSVTNSMNLRTNDTLYQHHEPLCWDASQIGYYTAYGMTALSILGMFYLWALRLMKICDEKIAMSGTVFAIGCFVMEAFVKNSWQMYMVPLIGFPRFNLAPVTRGVMSSLVGPEKQGLIFSSIALIEVGCQLVAATVYNKLYAMTVSFMPGAVYLVMAGVAFINLLLYIPFFHVYSRVRRFEFSIQAPDDGSEDCSQPEDSDDDCIERIR